MAAGKEILETYKPKMIFAGDFPVVKDMAEAAEGETISELMPVTLDNTGNIKAVTADTVSDIYGLAAEDAEAGQQTAVYLTGQFFYEAVNLPEGVTLSGIKTQLRKIGIFVVGAESETTTTE